MFRRKLIYRLLLLLLIFAFAFIFPLMIRANIAIDSAIETFNQEPGVTGFDPAHLKIAIKDALYDDIIVMSFYTFFIAFLLSMFFSREILLPIRRLFKGAEAIRKGDLNVSLPVMKNDELGEVTKIFNKMARSLKEDTEVLKKKDLYIRTMMDAMWVLDKEDTIVDINPAFTELFGYDKDEVVGMSVYDFLDEENTVIMKYELESNRQKGESSTYQISLLTKDGDPIPVLITGAPIIEAGEVTGKIGVIKDFREQSDLMRKLLESKKNLETIMNSIDDKMLLINRDYTIINANEKAFEAYGYDIIGKQCHSVSHDKAKPCWVVGENCPVQKVLVHGGTWKTIHEHYHENGMERFDEIMASPVKDIDGEIKYVVELVRDVTESKKFEETISKKNRELSTLNEISTIMSSSLKLESIFSDVVAKLVEVLDMEGGGVYLIDEGRKVLDCVYHRGVSEDFISKAGRVRLGEDIPGRVAVTGEGIMISDVSRDYRVERSIVRFSGLRGYCCIPLRGKERILGVICLFSFREHYFSEEEQRILVSVGKMAGIAADNINLYEQVRGLYDQQRKRRIKEQDMFLNLVSSVASSTDIEELALSTIESAKEYFNASASWFALIDESNEITIDVCDGLILNAEERTLPSGAFSIEKAVSISGDYLIVDDIFREKKYYIPEVLTRNNIRTVVSIPVKVGGQVYGVISLFYRNVTIVKDEDMHFLLIVASLLTVSIETADIFEKRIMDRGLAEAVFDSISEGVTTIDPEGYITFANSSAKKILNVVAANMIGRHYADVIPHEDDHDTCPVKQSLHGTSGDSETTIIGPGGEEITLHVSSTPLVDINGKVKGAVQVIRDITKARRMDQMKSELIRSVSHEFRTPLSAIVGMAEMLLAGDVKGERAREYLRTINAEGMRLSNMVSDLLDLSRIENGKNILRDSDIEIRVIIDEVLTNLIMKIEEKDAKIDVEIDEEAIMIHADKDKLKQVMENVLHNALTYSDSKVTITIRVKKVKNYIIIVVRDSGWGMSDEDRAHVGDKFFRGSYADNVKGTGLGIALCKELVQLHHGDLHIDSRLNEGTTVTIKIPLRSVKSAKSNGN
jgi:PAS domain S-box-containing protein